MADLYLDEDVSLVLGRLLTARGHSVIAAKQVKPPRTPDHEQLATAVRSGWILLTHNEADFLSLHRAWRDWFLEWGRPPFPSHPGVVSFPQPPRLRTEAAADVLDQLVSVAAGVHPLRDRFYRWSTLRGWEERT